MKSGDVYRFEYHFKEGAGDRYWCFDGQLVVKARGDGSLFLHDTYWHDSLSGRTFTPEEAREQGELTFVCNLDDVEPLEPYALHNFAPEDIFNLSHQHGCYKRFMKRKGAPRNREAMLKHLREKLAEARRAVDSAVRSVESTARDIERVESAADLEKLCV